MVLALISSLFLITASVTGVILALEPLKEFSKGYAVTDLSEVSVAETVSALRSENSEVLYVEIDSNDFVLASVINNEGKSESVYVNPSTAEVLGKSERKPWIFEFSKNLHRSLSFKEHWATHCWYILLSSLFDCDIGIHPFGSAPWWYY